MLFCKIKFVSVKHAGAPPGFSKADKKLFKDKMPEEERGPDRWEHGEIDGRWQFFLFFSVFIFVVFVIFSFSLFFFLVVILFFLFFFLPLVFLCLKFNLVCFLRKMFEIRATVSSTSDVVCRSASILNKVDG